MADTAIRPVPMPDGALLQSYRQKGAYTDAYCMDVAQAVALHDYVAAFYTSPLFRVERFLLGVAARRPASDRDAMALAAGHVAAFSAWTVEGRTEDQLLMGFGPTRSWLMAQPMPGGATRLYFGSAVVPASRSASGEPVFGPAFHALGGFHRVYTRALMRSARSRLAA